MTEVQDDKLLAACERIRSQKSPAYIKGSEMRYLAVNAAYCQLFGLSEHDLVGRSGDEVGEVEGHEDRTEHERRCLVFGNDETARLFHEESSSSFIVSMRRERISGEALILVGTLSPAAGTLANGTVSRSPKNSAAEALRFISGDDDQNHAEPAPAESDPALAEQLLDAIGTGIAIFDRTDRMVHANRVMREFYRALLGDVPDDGINTRSVLAAIHDVEFPDVDAAEREAWIEQRLAEYELPLFERISRTVADGWTRLVTQRRPDGTLIALRSDVTNLKENEGRLLQQGQEIGLYRALLDELPVATFVRDQSQRLIFANRAFLDLTGTDANDILGKTTREMFPLQGELFHAKNQRVIDHGELIEAEIDFWHPDGTKIPTISRSYRVKSADNRNYLIGSITDTSPLKRREDQLIEARRQSETIKSDLESIVASLHVGIVVVDENSAIELVNGAFEGLWDGTLPELKGKPLGTLLRFKREQGETIEEHAGVCDTDYDAWLCRVRDGSFPSREVSFANGRTLIESGQPISGGRCLLTYIDITERREREREVLETRSALAEVGSLVKDAMSAMGQGLLIIDNDRVELANEALFSMINVPEELLQPGALLKDVIEDCERRDVHGFAGEERIGVRDFIPMLLRDRSVSIILQSGKGLWLQLDARPTEHGRVVLAFSDITELKAREDELRGLVVRAETADRAKSEFLANMSHEIRTPMNGVLGMAELLAKSDLDTRQKTFIDIMVKSGNALLTIINDILDYSKIDAGQMSLRVAPFNLVEAVEDVATLLAARAAEKNLELIVCGSADVPAVVFGDAGRFRQIVTNLVGNAVKFTDQGHVRIDMSASDPNDRNINITLRVEDTGVGIPADKLASVFEKFSQVDSSSTRRHEGTGLGLAITDGLVTLFGGTLSAESSVGEGSVFTVTLPLEIEHVASSPASVPSNLHGARILVADPNEGARSVVRDLLREWGFDATAVGNADEALALLSAATAIDITVEAAIIDKNMRDGGGRNLIAAIREDFPRTALVSLSALGAPVQEGGLEALETDAHLMKPIRAALLREAVCDVIRSGRHRKPATEKAPTAAGARRRLPGPSAAQIDVLVAEDNDVNQILFRQLLENADVSFELVANGEQAVEAYRELKPRMILMDVSMPVMNGYQASRAIRDLEKDTRNRVPIVGVTAHVLDGDREACVAAGMDDYLTKPISIDRLEEMVQRWLKVSGRADAKKSTLH